MKDVLKTFNVTSSSCWLWVIISIIVHLGSISLQLQGVCAVCRQALSFNVVQEQLSYSSTCLDVVVEWKSWVRVESNGVEWKSWIRIDSINTTLYQPVTMPAAIGDQQLYNKEPLHTKALLLPRESQQRSWAPRLPLSLPQLPPLSNGGDNAALQGCGDFSVHVSNALLTWKELCKYNDFYSCISVFDSRGIAGYTMGFFYLFLYDFSNSAETIWRTQTDVIRSIQTEECSLCWGVKEEMHTEISMCSVIIPCQWRA